MPSTTRRPRQQCRPQSRHGTIGLSPIVQLVACLVVRLGFGATPWPSEGARRTRTRSPTRTRASEGERRTRTRTQPAPAPANQHVHGQHHRSHLHRHTRTRASAAFPTLPTPPRSSPAPVRIDLSHIDDQPARPARKRRFLGEIDISDDKDDAIMRPRKKTKFLGYIDLTN
ncbi:hypothetical protein B0H10DRAFT_2238949 [Mycena sp. CBHHK59/15]|nr:hypothetical protein B0H10DRAFT_2238949 [Mycena sp. CBHHK59/15]